MVIINREVKREQYCQLDKMVLDRKCGRLARMEDVISDKVLVIDTLAVYMFHLDNRTKELIYDLGDMRTEEDIWTLRKIVLEKLGIR